MSPADLVLRAGVVHTLDATGTPAPRSLAITDGVVVAIGDDAVLRLIGPGTTVIDLPGAAVLPGYVDSHIHPVLGIELTRGVDLSPYRDLGAVEDALRTAAGALAGDAWLLGWGLDPTLFGSAEPTADLLSAAAPGRRAYVTLFDAHSAIASPSALAEAGITGTRAFPDASRIAVDEHGDPTGLLVEFRAMEGVLAVVPPLTPAERVGRLSAILRAMAETGFTAGHVLDLNDDDALDLLEELERTGELPLDLRLSPWCVPGSDEADWRALVDQQHRAGRRWRIEGVKLMIDGTIDNGTAWLSEPDARGESTASLWLDPAEYTRAVRFFHAAGVPTATHAIGDGGVDHVARTLAALPAGGPRHRLEHLETVTDATLGLLASAGVAISMQPTHCTHFTTAERTDNWSVRLGAGRAERLGFRTRDVREAGMLLALGSDWPVAPCDARHISADARLRHDVARPGATPIAPQQALTALQVVEGFTRHAHASIGSEGGVLAVGRRADVTVFDRDPLTATPESFAGATVLLTLIRGEIVVDGRPAGAAG